MADELLEKLDLFALPVDVSGWLLKVYPLCRSLLPRYWVSFDTYHRPRYILFSGSLLTRYWVSFDTYHRPRYILFSGSLLTLYWVSFDTYHRS